MQNISTAHGVAQPLTPSLSPQPQNNSFLPPWCESSFVPIPREFYAIRHLLSKAACEVFEGHCCNAMTTGENAGISCQYRENFGEKFHMSTKKLDRANAELAALGMIERLSRSRNQSQSWRILKPSKWRFQEVKFVARTPQNRVVGDSKPNPTTVKDKKKSFKEKTQNNVVASSKPSLNVEQPEPDIALVRQLLDYGVEGPAARYYASAEPDECKRQLEFFPHRPASEKTDAAHLVASILGKWCDPREKKGRAPSKPISASIPVSGPKSATTPETNQDNDSRANEIPTDTEKARATDIQNFAQKASVVFNSLSEKERSELLTLARRDVSPIWHDRVGQPDSPMSLGLWQLVVERYAEKLK